MRWFVCALLGLLFTIGGCSSRDKEIKRILESPIEYNAYVSPYAEFTRYVTWDWVPVLEARGVDPRADDPKVRRAIEDAIANQMGVREYVRGTVAPNLVVNYHLATQDIDKDYMKQMYDGKYLPDYRIDFRGPRKARYEWEEGSLIIFIFDTSTRELIWRGAAKAEIAHDAPFEQSVERLNKVMKHVFTSFPGRPLGS